MSERCPVTFRFTGVLPVMSLDGGVVHKTRQSREQPLTTLRVPQDSEFHTTRQKRKRLIFNVRRTGLQLSSVGIEPATHPAAHKVARCMGLIN